MTHAQFSSKGGKARKKALSAERRSQIARKAAKASWVKRKASAARKGATKGGGE